MALSSKRITSATSSTIVSLVANGKGANTIGSAFFTYVEECRYEKSLLQNLESEIEVLATDYGKLTESFVHERLPNDYRFHSNETKSHPKYLNWVGTADGTKMVYRLKKWVKDAITDIKCPLTKKAFCSLVSGLYEELPEGGVKKIENPNMNKALEKCINKAKDGKKFFWQLVSNSCIEQTKYAELIVFMPYKETLEKLVAYNESLDYETDKNKYDGKPKISGLVSFASMKDNKLPFILKESGYEEINIIRFEVPIWAKILLEKRFKMFDACMDLSTDEYDLFLENASKEKYKEDAILSLLNLE